MFDEARLGTGVTMEDAIMAARNRVPNPYPSAAVRRLRQVAPVA